MPRTKEVLAKLSHIEGAGEHRAGVAVPRTILRTCQKRGLRILELRISKAGQHDSWVPKIGRGQVLIDRIFVTHASNDIIIDVFHRHTRLIVRHAGLNARHGTQRLIREHGVRMGRSQFGDQSVLLGTKHCPAWVVVSQVPGEVELCNILDVRGRSRNVFRVRSQLSQTSFGLLFGHAHLLFNGVFQFFFSGRYVCPEGWRHPGSKANR